MAKYLITCPGIAAREVIADRMTLLKETGVVTFETVRDGTGVLTGVAVHMPGMMIQEVPGR